MSETNVQLPAFFGIKAGMTRIFDEGGKHVPVTVVRLVKNVVSQVKTTEKEGHNAYQIAYQEKREKNVNGPKKGQLKAASAEGFFNRFAEISVDEVNPEFLGKSLDFSHFLETKFVDVTGVTKGKGFQGVIKRYGFAGGPATHGSKFHRRTGSIGNRATPGKVWKNKKMPGHMGQVKQTVQNLQIVGGSLEKGYLLIKGSVPGAKNSFIKVAKATKKA